MAEYEKGNYVIVGGDWNQTPYGFEPGFLPISLIPSTLLMWKRIILHLTGPGPYDPLLPTNRRVAVPYNQATSLTTVIDYYLLSPNIRWRSKNH